MWDFQYEPPIFEGDKFQLSDAFPVFANLYQVIVTLKGNQSFLKCNCQLYEHCGMPCSCILVITHEIEDTMIAVQHQKVLQVYYGIAESKLSTQLMKATLMQNIHKEMGMPITNECLERSSNPTGQNPWRHGLSHGCDDNRREWIEVSTGYAEWDNMTSYIRNGIRRSSIPIDIYMKSYIPQVDTNW